ncbi:Conjugative transposon protein TraH [Phocaeicola vulgatus]|uniref:Conjugative transposon protein TraH n=1 Tax=Phocaeicola vulgatus TaxID=821 RepID=A0A0P0LB02_PHOVU|nr:Conjugative transposon protein TraH [Phocaeicola vulgatus]
MSDRAGGHGAAILRNRGQPPRPALRELGERGGKPDVLIYKEGEAYKVTVFRRSGLRRRLKPETYLLQEENGNLFMNTGFRIDVSYNEATDVLTFSPNGDYVRVNPKPDHPASGQ